MAGILKLIQSGFPLIDQNWGGIYRGGSYILIGPRKSGRTLIGLQFAMEAAKSNEVCLYFTNMRPKDLMIQAASINFDIQSYMNQNLIIVVRVAPPNEIYETRDPDRYLVEYLNDIITVIGHYNPTRIVFDELTPYIGFNNLTLLREAFVHTLEAIEDRDITSLFILGEPATQRAQEIVDVLTNEVTGLIYLKKSVNLVDGKFHGGIATIIPNVGHTEGQFSAEYLIEPFKGVTLRLPEPKEPPISQTASYSPVKEAEKAIEEVKKSEPPSENLGQPLSYNKNDFMLILNNQIALYKSTGQKFQVIAFRLDPVAEVTRVLGKEDLLNAIKKSTTKKEKICVVDNKVLVLQLKGTTESLIEMMHKVARNLPASNTEQLSKMLEAVTVHFKEVNEGIDKAEDIMEELLLEKSQEDTFYLPLNKYLG
jgi:circadian clock protein KaiC